MIEVEIPNNISEYKPKLLLGLTGKQVVCVVLTAFCIFVDFKFLKPYIGEMFAMALAIIPAAIAAMFGWVEPYGMTFDKYLKSVLLQAVLAPKARKAKTLSSVVVPCDKNCNIVSDSELSEEVLNCVVQVREASKVNEGDASETTETKAKRKKKPRYKKSPQAML